MAAPDINRLRELFHYNPETGELIWKPREETCSQLKVWNIRYAGTVAGSISASDGYRYVTVDNRNTKTHRVIFAIMEGRWPKEVDHINRDKTDNRWSNLRESSRTDNMRNTKVRSDSITGIKGVTRDKSSWRAYIQVKGKPVNLGSYAVKEEAIAARRKAESKYWHN